MKYVDIGGRLVPRSVMEPPINPPKGSCTRCGGYGSLPESIDDERAEVMAPCFMCQEFCKVCKDWKKKGHVCTVANPPAATSGI